MKTLIVFIAGLGFAQTSGPIKSASVKVHAGASYCTFTNHKPMALTGLHIECGSASVSMALDTVIAVGSNGHGGQFSEGQNTINWTFQRPSADGALMYKVVANGKAETGSL